MRAVIQRVSQASVTIAGQLKSSIQRGLLVLIGVEESDSVGETQGYDTGSQRQDCCRYQETLGS